MTQQRVLEVSNLITPEHFIEFNIFDHNFFNENEDLVPFPAYYYEALKLCINKITDRDAAYLNDFITFIYKSWFVSSFCDDLSFEKIKSKIKKDSQLLSNVISKLRSDGGLYLSEESFDVLNRDFSNVSFVDDLFDKWEKRNKKVIQNFGPYKRSCCAIAIPIEKRYINENACYLSLSGTSEDYIGKVAAYKYSTKFQEAYKYVNELIKFVFGFKFKECHLTDETKRYTFYENSVVFDKDDINGQVLKRPVNFKRDYFVYKNLLVRRYYSCCERKIIAAMKFINRDYFNLIKGNKIRNVLNYYEFRISKEPCRMCRPALIGCNHIKIGFCNLTDLLTSYCNDSFVKYSGRDKREPLYIVSSIDLTE